MPEKNNSNELEKELTYCKELGRGTEKEPALSAGPAVKEKLNLLKETIEDTQENFTLSKVQMLKRGVNPRIVPSLGTRIILQLLKRASLQRL